MYRRGLTDPASDNGAGIGIIYLETVAMRAAGGGAAVNLRTVVGLLSLWCGMIQPRVNVRRRNWGGTDGRLVRGTDGTIRPASVTSARSERRKLRRIHGLIALRFLERFLHRKRRAARHVEH